MTTEKMVNITEKKNKKNYDVSLESWNNWIAKLYKSAGKKGLKPEDVQKFVADNYETKFFEREDNRKRFVGSFWVHPSAGGDDRCYDFEIKANSLEEAKLEVVAMIKKKRSAIITDYYMEEAKPPQMSDKKCPVCGKFLPVVDKRGMTFKPYHYKGSDCCSYECVFELELKDKKGVQ